MGAMAASESPGRDEPVERFRPTSGQVVGHLTLAVIGILVVNIAVNERTVTGLRAATGMLFFGAVVWTMLLRPRVTAYADALHMHNSVRDVVIPYVAVEDVTLGRVLSVWAGERRYVCTGIGAPARTVARGAGRGPASLAAGTATGPGQGGYAGFVRSRILELVEDAKRRAAREGGTTDARPRHVWAWRQVVVLGVTGAAFVVSLLL